MSSSRWTSWFWFLACFSFHAASHDLNDVTATVGDDVTLQCLGPRDAIILLLRWRRPDLSSDEYVFYFSDNHTNEEYQHPSFHGRVELKDPKMKDGDAAVILKKVTIDDAGTYECEVGVTGGRPELISTTTLTVEPVQITITAEPGQNVTLTCHTISNTIITAVEWTRTDLEPEYVLLYRDGQPDPENQHPSFKNRVELKDKQMKDGDVSLVLKDVNNNDRGTYKCRVNQNGTNIRKRSNINNDPISIITLTVEPGPSGD